MVEGDVFGMHSLAVRAMWGSYEVTVQGQLRPNAGDARRAAPGTGAPKPFQSLRE